MTDDIKQALIRTVRTELSNNKLSGFRARAHLLFLAFLRGRSYTQIEPQIDQGTFHRVYQTHGPMQPGRKSILAQAVLQEVRTSNSAALLLLDPFWGVGDLEGWEGWCKESYSCIKPVRPRAKKVRPSNRGKSDAAQ